MATLDGGRIGIAAQALGIAEGAIDETVAYVKERKQFGRSIAQFQNTQFELAEMKARVDAAKYLVYKAGLKKQQAMNGAKIRYSVEAAEACLLYTSPAPEMARVPLLSAFTWPYRSTSMALLMEIKLSRLLITRTSLV